jgi:hypothetical protein
MRDGVQVHRLDTLPLPEQLDAAIRARLTRVMRSPACLWSRIEIAEFMSRRINPTCELGPGQPVSLHMINSWTAAHRRRSGRSLRFPAAFVPLFCEITRNFELMHLIVGPYVDKLLELRDGELETKESRARLRRRKRGQR